MRVHRRTVAWRVMSLALLVVASAVVAASAEHPVLWLLVPSGRGEAWVPLRAGALTGLPDVPGAPPAVRAASAAAPVAAHDATSWDGTVLHVEGWPDGARVTIDGLDIAPSPGTRRALKIALPPGRHAAELAGPGMGVFRLTFEVLATDRNAGAAAPVASRRSPH